MAAAAAKWAGPILAAEIQNQIKGAAERRIRRGVSRVSRRTRSWATGAVRRRVRARRHYIAPGDSVVRRLNFTPSTMPMRRGRYGRRRRYRRRSKKARFSRRAIGKPIGSATCKRRNVSNTFANEATRNLGQFQLVQIPQQVDHEIDRRERDICQLRGFKMCLSVKSKDAFNPHWFHYAVVIPKAGRTASATQFFKGNGPDRDIDFSLALNGLEFNCLPINTDLYTILWHKRIFLTPQTTSQGGGNEYMFRKGSNFKYIRKYMKINRQIRFGSDAGTTTPIADNPLLIWWGARHDGGSGDASTANLFDLTFYITTYFRDAF